MYRLLARNRATGEINEAAFAQIKKDGIDSYYKQLPEKDKALYHQRVGERCMNYARNSEALEHYRQLMRLQGACFKVVGNMFRLKFRLLGKNA